MRAVLMVIFLMLVLVACNKKKYPNSVTNGQSTFYFKATVNNSPVSVAAGINNYYMYSTLTQDSNNVYNFSGSLKAVNCTNNCANSIRIQINDFKVSAHNAPVVLHADSSFVPSYPFGISPISTYDIQFYSSYNKTATTYLWDFGDGTTSSLANPLHTYAKRGTYKVCLTVNGSNACVSSICNTQKIGLPGNPCQTSIELNYVSGNTLAFIQTTTGRAPFTYLWDFGDGGRSVKANPTHNYTIPGSYLVSLRVIDANNDESQFFYNAVTQSDGSSCAANFQVHNPTIGNDAYLNLSSVFFSWTDANGLVYNSENVQQPASTFFQILSVEDYQDNENGQKTKKLHIKLKCDVINGTNRLTIDNAEAVICVAY